jgi:hypothetical protein
MVKSVWYRRAVVTGAVLVLGAGPALAGGPVKSTTGGSDQYKSGSGATSASPRAEGAGQFTGRHTMDGEVTRIDQSKGTLSLKTAEGTMDLHFPPRALANIKKGDQIAVELALKPSAGSASPRTEKTPATEK